MRRLFERIANLIVQMTYLAGCASSIARHSQLIEKVFCTHSECFLIGTNFAMLRDSVLSYDKDCEALLV